MKNLSLREDQLVRSRITLGQILSKSAVLFTFSLAKPDSFLETPHVT